MLIEDNAIVSLQINESESTVHSLETKKHLHPNDDNSGFVVPHREQRNLYSSSDIHTLVLFRALGRAFVDT